MKANNNCKINDIHSNQSSCNNLTRNGVKSIHLIESKYVNEFHYLNDDYSIVDSYDVSSNFISVELNNKGNSAVFNSFKTYSNRPNEGIMWENNLTVSLNESSMFNVDVRDSIELLENSHLMCIFSDFNDNCWIMGGSTSKNETPYCTIQSIKSNVSKSNSNGFTFVLQSTQPKQVIKLNDCSSIIKCFSSSSYSTVKSSTFVFTVDNSNTYSYLDTDVNGFISTTSNIANYTALQPSLWSSNTNVYNGNMNLLNQLFTNNDITVNVQSVNGSLVSNKLTIIVESNILYGTLQLDNEVINATSQSDITTFNGAIDVSLQNVATEIAIRSDVYGLLYQGPYNQPIPSTPQYTNIGLQGSSPLSYSIDISKLNQSGLPDIITTEVIVNGAFPLCFSTYNYTPSILFNKCELGVDYNFVRGNRVTQVVSLSNDDNNQRFQNITINICGVQKNFYQVYSSWHGSFVQFQTDFINYIMSSSELMDIIDISTVTFIDSVVSIVVNYELTKLYTGNTNKKFFCNSTIVNSLDSTFSTEPWKQEVLLNFRTSFNGGINSSSVIEHNTISSAPSSTYSANGLYNSSIQNNTFVMSSNLISNTSSSNATINDMFVSWHGYNLNGSEVTKNDVNTVLTTTTNTFPCNVVSYSSELYRCFDKFFSKSRGSFKVIVFDVSTGSINLGNHFQLDTFDVQANNTNSVNFTLPSNVTPHSGLYLLNNELSKYINTVSCNYDALKREYYFYYYTNNTIDAVILKDLTNFRQGFDVKVTNVFNNSYSNGADINPYIKAVYSFNPYYTPLPLMPMIDGSQGIFEIHEVKTPSIKVTYDLNSSEVDWNKELALSQVQLLNQCTLTFHTGYPTSSNQVIFGVIQAGVTSNLIQNIQSNLSSQGLSLSDVVYMSYTNNIGQRFTKEVDLTKSFVTTFNESSFKPSIWGMNDYVNYAGISTTQVISLSTDNIPFKYCN